MIEADFQREYSINLVEQGNTLSWRRFLALLQGLSMHSVFINTVMNDTTKNNEPILEDPNAIKASLASIIGR